MKVSIVIPAHNEEKRISRTLLAYYQFFNSIQHAEDIDFELLVILNGCTDGTLATVEELAERCAEIRILEFKDAGKGLAVREGFIDAITRPNHLIGFVDADMATEPQFFYDLVVNIGDYDGIIASRYMPQSIVIPPRPAIKRLGSKLIYEPLVRMLFGLNYYDLQCGAKLFKKPAIKKVLPYLTVDQWAFDVELLYWCKQLGLSIQETPTTWHDQADSKLDWWSSGLGMIKTLFALSRQVKNKEINKAAPRPRKKGASQG